MYRVGTLVPIGHAVEGIGVDEMVVLPKEVRHLLRGAHNRGEKVEGATMVEYRIVCANKSGSTPAHRHIIQVGTGAHEAQADRQWTVAEVRAEISQGTRFYTVSESTWKVAEVDRYDCSCGFKTIKTRVDSIKDNNLDNLRPCRVF